MNSMLKLMPTMIRLSGDSEEVREQAAFAAWRIVTGPQISYSCIPLRLEQKHLIVAVPDFSWKNQMEKVSGDYLFRLNSVIGMPVVTYIQFHIDYGFVKKTQEAEPKPMAFEHTAELTEELRADAAQIEDEKLREQFLRAAAKYLERKGETVKPESTEN